MIGKGGGYGETYQAPSTTLDHTLFHARLLPANQTARNIALAAFGRSTKKVDYALAGRLPVLAFTRDDPRAFAFFEAAERWVGKDGIVVTTKERAEVERLFGRHFERLVPLGPVPVGRRGRTELTLFLYRGERLKAPYPQPYG